MKSYDIVNDQLTDIAPLGSLLFIEPISDSILVIDPKLSWKGKVVAAGPEAQILVGDTVYLKPTNAIEATFGVSRLWIVQEKDLLAYDSTA